MKNTQGTHNDFAIITGIIHHYFEGLHQGDVAKLTSIFHADTWLKAPGIRRSLQEWLTDVANRPTPKQQGRSYQFKLLSLDVVQDQAMVKIQCPLFDFNYIDYLGLLKENGQWLIVNKMYTNFKEAAG